jgi:hypothetical protein
VEISRKKLREEVLDRVKYVRTCVMARELCLLFLFLLSCAPPRCFRAQKMCKTSANISATYAKKKAAPNPAACAKTLQRQLATATKKNTSNSAPKAASNAAKQNDPNPKKTPM